MLCSLSLPNYSTILSNNTLDYLVDSVMYHEKEWLVVQATIIGDLVGPRYFVLKNKGIGNMSACFFFAFVEI